MTERESFEARYPRAVWRHEYSGYEELEHCYAFAGWIACAAEKDKELLALKSTINAIWNDTYPGAVDTQDLNALQCRVKNLAEDRACWVFNARVANNKLNELEGKK